VDRQDALDAGFNPAGLIERLALWAVAISARVVGGLLEATIGTHVEMAAECSRPTCDECACSVLLAWGQGVELAIPVEVAAKDVRHLERRSRRRRARRASDVR
jgi:cytochrome b